MPTRLRGSRRWFVRSLLAASAVGGAAGSLLRMGGVRAAPATPVPASPPALRNGAYQLPPGNASVVHVSVSKTGSIPPPEEGHDIDIDAGGRATIKTLILPGPGTPVNTQPQLVETRQTNLGVAGLQALLGTIAATGFFALPQPQTMPPIVGDPFRALTVALADGTWSAQDSQLAAAGIDPAPLLAAVAAVEAAVGGPEATPAASPAAGAA